MTYFYIEHWDHHSESALSANLERGVSWDLKLASYGPKLLNNHDAGIHQKLYQRKHALLYLSLHSCKKGTCVQGNLFFRCTEVSSLHLFSTFSTLPTLKFNITAPNLRSWLFWSWRVIYGLDITVFASKFKNNNIQ